VNVLEILTVPFCCAHATKIVTDPLEGITKDALCETGERVLEHEPLLKAAFVAWKTYSAPDSEHPREIVNVSPAT
jgi:hypothetical protein